MDELKSLVDHWVLLAQGLIGSIGALAFLVAFLYKIVAVEPRAVMEATRWIGRIVFGTIGVEIAGTLTHALISTVPATLRGVLAFRPDPPLQGGADATLRLLDGMGQPVQGARLQATWLMPQHAHVEQTAWQEVASPVGTYQARPELSMAGAWLAVSLPSAFALLAMWLCEAERRAAVAEQ